MLALLGIVVGGSYLLLVIVRAVRRHLKQGPDSHVPGDVVASLEKLRGSCGNAIRRQPATSGDSKTIGIYLGAFATPATPLEAGMLSKWDILVLDPFNQGVYAAAAAATSTQIIGRLDFARLESVLRPGARSKPADLLKDVHNMLCSEIKGSGDLYLPFTGVLLAEWRDCFTTEICCELVKHFRLLGLDVYLEAAGPEFLTEKECKYLGLELVQGIICRNGTILRNGDRSNYYQMANMRRTQRALAKHMSLGGVIFAMWETIDDGVHLPHAIAKRSSNWCRFNTAPSWVGPESALYDPEVAAQRSLAGEPVGALMWLKSNESMAVHDTWRQNGRIVQRSVVEKSPYDGLDDLIPDLVSKLQLQPSIRRDSVAQAGVLMDATIDWSSLEAITDQDPFSVASDGRDYTGLGCFQLGLDASAADFQDLLQGQVRLRDLGMLERLQNKELLKFRDKLKPLSETPWAWADMPYLGSHVVELLQLLEEGDKEEAHGLRIYVGMHSGFHRGTHQQYWGLYEAGPPAGKLDIYLSGRCSDRAGAVLHTFMSSKGYTRLQCLTAEAELGELVGEFPGGWQLPPRLVKDVEELSSAELLLLLQRCSFSRCERSTVLSARIQALCRHQLLDVPSLSQLREINTSGYISGDVSAEQVVETRLEWYRDQGCWIPDAATSIALFREIDSRLPQLLMEQRTDVVEKLEKVLFDVINEREIDAGADMFALSVFCAFRKLAVDEVLLEILDRNPLPNRHADQAACFAEMFATGSQCETYFDMTAKTLGRILAGKYQKYYKEFQPPYRPDSSIELPTAYASKQVDENPEAKRAALPVWYQITFLGIFAFPALIDILLLTFIGRGLYLSTYMDKDVKRLATAGLFAGLVLVGGVGTWIGHGGSYYLFANAFPAMTMFVLTRFTAGIAVITAVGIPVFFMVGGIIGWYPALFFIFYFATMSIYLILLASLAIYQFPGFKFQSGRMTVVACLPLLVISPILTLWIGHDEVVYPCVISGFIFCLLLGTRKAISRWCTWYLNIPLVNDTEMVNFYTNVTAPADIPQGVSDLAATPLPRKALMEALNKELDRPFWVKSTADELIRKLAGGYESTVFLMDWYCKYSRTPMPYPFSPTWNLMCKTAIDTLKDMQKGLPLHNAFIHWRFGGEEVWCGVLYFLIALMDKWIALVTGEQVVGFSAGDNGVFRLPVGFGLAYYLMSAIALDAVAQPLWPKANKKTEQQIVSLDFLRQAALNDAKARRKLYWTNLIKFACMHIWGFSVTGVLMWVFSAGEDPTIIYLAYVASYSGLLFYQYNRIYTLALAKNDLLIATILGFIVGPVLRSIHGNFNYSAVIALGVSTWTAALLSMRTAKVIAIWPRPWKIASPFATSEAPPSLYFYSFAGPSPGFSQRTLSEIFDSSSSYPDDEKLMLQSGTHPGSLVSTIIRSKIGSKRPDIVTAAFPNADTMLVKILASWEAGHIVVEMAPFRYLHDHQKRVRYITRLDGARAHLRVFVRAGENSTSSSQLVAEALVATANELFYGMSHDHAQLTELLISGSSVTTRDITVPIGLRRQLGFSMEDRKRVSGDKDLVTSRLLFGLNCDLEWEALPRDIKVFLLTRLCSKDCRSSEPVREWLASRAGSGLEALSWAETLARSNLAVLLASKVRDYAREYVGVISEQSADVSFEELLGSEIPVAKDRTRSGYVKGAIVRAVQVYRFAVKFLVIASTADAGFQRELDYASRRLPGVVRWPARLFLNAFWNYCKLLQSLIIPVFMFAGRPNIDTLRHNMRGIRSQMKGNRVLTQSFEGESTGFLKTAENGNIEFHQYSGNHKTQPEDATKLRAINTYDDKMVLRRREEYVKGAVDNIFTYEYAIEGNSKIPVSRNCIAGSLHHEMLQYDRTGHISSGSHIKDGNLIRFTHLYRKNARFEDELLRAAFILDHASIHVSWCVPPTHHAEKSDRWLPDPRIQEATFIEGKTVYHCKWSYDHRSHPVLTTTLNGDPCETPDMIQHDWFKVLKKPKNCSFVVDNPLLGFRNTHSNVLVRALQRHTKWYPVSTATSRNHLWKTWKGSKDVDAVTAQWLDDAAMRSDKILQPYWFRRDWGLLSRARAYLYSNADGILAKTDLDPDISAWSLICYKYGDLDSCGPGGDTGIRTRSQATQINDSEKSLHVLAMDTGTWPNEGGGVSACRRDMVNDLSTIKWHIIAENANDYGTPKFQTERNVQSLTVLPLWGMDFLTPSHGVFQGFLDSEIQERFNATSSFDIKKNFFPILTSLVKCARATKFDLQHVEEASRALVDLSTYFETRHWGEVWMSKETKEKWRELWLAEDVHNASPISEWFDAERPTLAHMDNALDMWHRCECRSAGVRSLSFY